jgi:hypothetical protein
MRIFSSISILGMACLIATGCQDTTYPGDFGLINCYPETMIISEWEGFGWACPPGGICLPDNCDDEDESTGGTHFPRLKTYPDEVTVVWHIQQDKNASFSDDKADHEYRDVIDLSKLSLKGAKGKVVFKLHSDRKWTVKLDENAL